MRARRISSTELEVMRAWVGHEVRGADLLRSQLNATTEVYSSCDCGCPSIGFVNQRPSDGGVSVFDVDAEIVDLDGSSLGGMVLFTRDGWLHDVDVHSWVDDDLPFPALDRVRWHLRSG